MSEIPHLLVHNRKDNVGVVVVENLAAKTEARGCITEDNSTFNITVHEAVPIGHKVAITDLQPGDTAIKYGEDIGKVTAAIPKGRHLHIHNCKTKRW